ncbi:MAG: single-stranded DNA-binding protein [Candidatus Tectomicrobia bacterium]|nr:single-stranded DNA-binding protein [Candidatus Tectomicrobia bacterium]
MASFNKVILLGNLVRDPELRYTPGGTPVATFRLATNQRIRRRDEWIDEVCYIDIVTFGRQAETVGEYLSMGSQTLVEGRLNWRQWESQDGQIRGKYDVVANTVQFLSRPNSHAMSQASQDDLPFDTGVEAGAMDDLPF